jgi:hypothetical protein
MSHLTLFAGGLAWAALGLFCASARAQSATPGVDAESIVYATAPKFWEEVERVLKSDLKLYWTNSGVIDGASGERERIVDRSLAVLASLKSISLPQTQGNKRIRVFPEPSYPQYSLLGFLVREEPDAWIVFTSAWRIQRVYRVRHTKIEPSDVNNEIDAALKVAAMVQGNRDPNRRLENEIPTILKDGQNRFPRPDFLFDLAYLAYSSDRKQAVEPLLRAAFYQSAELLVDLGDKLSWRQFETAVLDLNQGVGRAGLARQFQRIATEFPGGKYEKQATEYARKLQLMALEDAQWRKPPSLTQLVPAERMKALIYQLRDCDAEQESQPGSCWIPSCVQPMEDAPLASAADQLIAEGFDAVPALITALDDSRLTRSYGYDRNFIPWRYVLEVRDAAIQSLVVLSDDQSERRLYHPNSTGLYFSNDTAERRGAAMERVMKWWTEAQVMGEAEWLRSRLRNPGQSRAMLLRRLVRVEQERALPDVRKWLAEEKHNRTYAYQLLMRAGGTAAVAEVQTCADPAQAAFDFAALIALHREQHLSPAQYTAALLKGAKTIAKREAGKLPGQVLLALAETGDRQCILMVAEQLRTGKSSFDLTMGWALGKIDDPVIGAEVAAYLLPYFDVVEPRKDSGWRQYYMGQKDIYRLKDDAAFAVNRLLGDLLPAFHDLTPPERDAEIEKLRTICTERGIRPAFDAKRPDEKGAESGNK